jgi:hypothetical protein
MEYLGLFAVHKIVSEYAARIYTYMEKTPRDTKLCFISAYNTKNFKCLKIISIYTIWHELSLKTISCYTVTLSELYMF